MNINVNLVVMSIVDNSVRSAKWILNVRAKTKNLEWKLVEYIHNPGSVKMY